MKGLKITLTLFFVFSTLLFSCEKEGQCGPYFPYFEIKGIALTNLKFTDSGANPWASIDESEAVDWEEYFIRVLFDVNYHASKQESSSGGANLYALSCIESGGAGSKAGVAALYVVTLQDYNHNYKANDTINDIVLLNDRTYFTKNHTEFNPLVQYIEKNKAGVLDEDFEIKLAEAPQETASDQRFKIIYQLTNGDTFEATSKTVKFNK